MIMGIQTIGRIYHGVIDNISKISEWKNRMGRFTGKFIHSQYRSPINPTCRKIGVSQFIKSYDNIISIELKEKFFYSFT